MGALYVRKNVQSQVRAQIHGGGHEQGLRSGTLPTHQLVGMGKAFELAGQLFEEDQKHSSDLRQLFLQRVKSLSGVSVNGHLADHVPGIISLSFSGQDGEVLLKALKELAISSGSACNSATVAPSYVLKAMGLSNKQALSTLRFSWGRFTTEAEIHRAVELVERLWRVAVIVTHLFEVVFQWAEQ